MRWNEKRPRQKVVVVDGPDGTGKTNIAYALSKAMDVPYFRMPSQHENWRKGRFKEALEFDQTYIAEFLRQTRMGVVIDRAYPAEWAYSRAFGRETNEEVLQQVDTAFARFGAYIVVPLRHDYSENKRDELVPNEMLPVLHTRYEEFCRWSKCSTIRIYVDAFDNSLSRQIPKIVEEFDWEGNVSDISFDVVLDRVKAPKDGPPRAEEIVERIVNGFKGRIGSSYE